MSWAAHNPEKYQEICIEGVTAKLLAAIKEQGFENYDEDSIRMAVETIAEQASARPIDVWGQLTGWASKEITDAEGNYWSGLADAYDTFGSRFQ